MSPRRRQAVGSSGHSHATVMPHDRGIGTGLTAPTRTGTPESVPTRTAFEPGSVPAEPLRRVRPRPPPRRVVLSLGARIVRSATRASSLSATTPTHRRGWPSLPWRRGPHTLPGSLAHAPHAATFDRRGFLTRHLEWSRRRRPEWGCPVHFVRSCRRVVQARYERPYGCPGTIVRIAEGAVPAHHGGAFLI